MNKSELNKVFYIRHKMKFLELKIAEVEDLATKITTSYDSSTSSSGVSDKVGTCSSMIADYTNDLKAMKQKELSAERDIMRYIRSINDERMQCLFIERCVNCKTWDDVALALGGYNTADNCKQAYCRYVNKYINN